MKSSKSRATTYWCRMADRLGVTAETGPKVAGGWAEAGERDRIGLFERWLMRHARRHVHGCDRCRTEKAEWTRIETMLRRSAGPKAPASLYDGVMAKIVAEKAVPARPVALSRKRPRRRSASGFPVFAPIIFGLPLSVAVLTALSFVTSFAVFFGRRGLGGLRFVLFVRRLESIVDSLGSLVGKVWGQGQLGVGSLLALLPPAAGPILTALLWAGIGWGVAVIVMVLTNERIGGAPR